MSPAQVRVRETAPCGRETADGAGDYPTGDYRDRLDNPHLWRLLTNCNTMTRYNLCLEVH